MILAEIRLGIVRLPRGRRRERLENWFSEGVGKLTCLSWDRKTAIRWADLILKVQGLGYTLPLFDSMIAATALVHGLVIVTRNVRDFEHAGVSVLNPFE
ncbi:MAG: PIN domain-containing protein [Verrucomicrobiota bacterium]